MAVEIVAPPAVEPVSLEEAKLHLRVEVSLDDALISQLIKDAREWAEQYTRRAMITQTRRLWTRRFPDGCRDEYGEVISRRARCAEPRMNLPGGVVKSVTSVKYVDTAGHLQTLDPVGYILDAKSPDRIAAIVPAYGYSWPTTLDEPNAVQVEYVAGYGDAAEVPSSIRQAILLHAGWHYENREPLASGGSSMSAIFNALELKLAAYRLFVFE